MEVEVGNLADLTETKKEIRTSTRTEILLNTWL